MIDIKSTAIVETDWIGDETLIEEYSIVRKNVKIGKNVHIYPHVIIENNVEIADNVRIYPGTYIGKVPDGAGAIVREPKFIEKITIGENCAVGPHAVIYYDVEIRNNTLIGDGASIRENCKIGSYCIIGRHVDVNYESTIGNHTKIMDFAVIERSIIGKNVFISMHVSMANDNKFYLRKYDPTLCYGPKIMDDASIGENATLLPNISIGRGSVVAAGAVVTKDVPDYAVVMGVPAKIVRYLDKVSDASK